MSEILSERLPLVNIDHLRGRKILVKFCGQFGGAEADFILHPLIYTLPIRTLNPKCGVCSELAKV